MGILGRLRAQPGAGRHDKELWGVSGRLREQWLFISIGF